MKSITRTTAMAVLLTGAAQGLAQTAATPAPAPAPKPAPKWETSASAGLTLTRGNSDSLNASLGFRAEKKWEKNEIKLGADGLYGKNQDSDGEDTLSAQSLSGYAQYNRLFTEDFYGYLRAEGLHDQVNAIKYRFTLSPGVGYYFIKKAQTSLDMEIGPGYVIEKTKEVDDTVVPPTTDYPENDYLTIRIAENFKHAFNERVRLWQKAEFLPQVDDFENFIINFEIGLEADITKKLSFQTKVIDTYDNVPAQGLEENDLKWVNAISYKF